LHEKREGIVRGESNMIPSLDKSRNDHLFKLTCEE
jgi:hypothetical protein